jgi:hypothetical protein
VYNVHAATISDLLHAGHACVFRRSAIDVHTLAQSPDKGIHCVYAVVITVKNVSATQSRVATAKCSHIVALNIYYSILCGRRGNACKIRQRMALCTI